MTIPSNIRSEHIIKALNEIDITGVPEGRESTKFNLVYNSKLYPPKYVISIANIFANSKELPPSEFYGGKETNRFLEELGFEILVEDENIIISSHSWSIISATKAEKVMDKSTFLHRGTGIPQEIREYFEIENFNRGDKKKILIEYSDTQYDGNILMDKMGRTKLLWSGEFAKNIRLNFPHQYKYFVDKTIQQANLIMKFTKLKENKFLVRIIETKILNAEASILSKAKEDIDAENAEEDEYYTDGAISYYYGKRYERNPENRAKAIQTHGLNCFVCGFNFEKVYGERGKDFIEVHHVYPLSSVQEEVVINPETDLVPLCSNCHRMIHRRKIKVLSVEELKQLLIKNSL